MITLMQLTTDQQYWLDRRAQIIEALAAQGLEIFSNKDSVWLCRSHAPDDAADARRYRSIRAALLSGGPEWSKLAAMLNIAPDTPAGVDDAVDVTFGLMEDE